MAAPTKYTEDLDFQICERISSSSEGLRKICKDLNISVKSVFNWLNTHPEFLQRYAQARENQADLMADEIIEIADDSTNDTKTIVGRGGVEIEVENTEWTNRSKLRVDARKWIASKLKPKRYGEKVDVTSDGKAIHQVTITEKTRES